MNANTFPTPRGAAWLATGLCVSALVFLLIPDTTPSASFSAFLSFLPVVFFALARRHETSERTIQTLEAKIAELERKLSSVR